MFRRNRGRDEPQVDLAALEPAWRRPVEEAVAARDRFLDLRRRVPPGPMRDRLEAMSRHVDEAVLSSWETASRAQAAQRVIAALEPEQATAELKHARRRLERLRDSGRADTAALEAEVDDLAARHAAVHRALNGVDDAARRLRMLDVRLDAAVAQALELVLRPTDVAGADRVDAELRGVVGELSALRSALEELG